MNSEPTAPPTTEAVPISRLHPAPWNPRTIKDSRFQALCRSIEADPDFLWQRPVLATGDGTIYGGNMRYRAVSALHKRGVWPEATIPAIINGAIDEQTAKARALRDNGDWGEWEPEAQRAQRALLGGLTATGFDTTGLGFDQAELNQLLGASEPRTRGLGRAAEPEGALPPGVRKVELIYERDAYAEVLDNLDWARAHYRASDNGQAVLAILREATGDA